MNFEDDERAQSVLIGSILLFAILIIAFSSYQAFVVPNQNAGVEFNHNDEVQTDMQDLRNSLLDIRSVQSTNGEYDVISEHRPVRIRLGAQYPARLVALNPPPASGTIEAVEATAPLRIENAQVSGGTFESDPSVLLESDLETAFISYRPSYTEYRDPPETIFEHSLLYNEFSNTEIPVRQQTMIRPETNRLNVVLFEGDVSQSGAQAVALDPETLDGPTASVPIESDGGPITVQIPTRSPEVWEETAADLDGVTLLSSQSDRVTVTLDDDEYDLRVTRVGFDGGDGTQYNELTPIQETPPSGGTGGDETLPGPRVSNVAGPDEGEEPLQDGDSFDLTADISNLGATNDERGGTPIQIAEWYLQGDDPGEGNGVSMTADNDGYIQDIELSVTDSVAATDLENGVNTIVVRAQDTRGVWGEETDSVDVEVQLDAAGTVTLQSEIREDDESFEVTTSDFENLDIDTGGFLVVENAVEFEINNVGESTETIDVADVGGIEADDEITATLYEDDTRSNELDADATTVLAEGEAFFDVTITDAPATVTEGDQVVVEYTIENTGGVTDIQDIEFLVDGQVTETESGVELTSGQTFDGTFTYQTDGDDVPEIELTVASDDDSDTRTVAVEALQVAPTVETNGATNVDTSSATLNGELTDIGSASEVEVYFQYRETGETAWAETGVQTLTAAETFEETVTGLESDTDYEFRAVAESMDGSDIGDIQTLTTDVASLSFTTLTAIAPTGGSLGDVEGELAVETDATVDITVFDGGTSVGSTTVIYQGTLAEYDITLSSPGQRSVPLTVVAEIQGGDCVEGEISERGVEITLENGDWEPC